MNVLVDSSVWIDYFRGGEESKSLDEWIDANVIATNDLILAELLPSLRMRKLKDLIELIQAIEKLNWNLDWKEIMEFQVKCMKKGLSSMEIPDLLIAQCALQNNVSILSLDKHFKKMAPTLGFKVMEG